MMTTLFHSYTSLGTDALLDAVVAPAACSAGFFARGGVRQAVRSAAVIDTNVSRAPRSPERQSPIGANMLPLYSRGPLGCDRCAHSYSIRRLRMRKRRSFLQTSSDSKRALAQAKRSERRLR